MAWTGCRVAAKVRETLHRQIPVIILTGDISTDTLTPIASQDCVQLNKPVKATDVMQAIQRLLSDLADPCCIHQRRLSVRMQSRRPIHPSFLLSMTIVMSARGFASLLEADGRIVEDFDSCESLPQSLSSGSRRMPAGRWLFAGNDGTGISAAAYRTVTADCQPS